jgi:hypothetical protein
MSNGLHAQTRGDEIVEFEFDCGKIDPTILGNIFKDEEPFENKKRKRIGVGEEIRLEFPEKWGKVTWEIMPSSLGVIVSTGSPTSSIVEFHAGLDAGKVTIRATPEETCKSKTYDEITYEIVAPQLNYIKYCDMHLENILDAGVYSRISLMPDDVSFHNISIIEHDCFPSLTGFLTTNQSLTTLSHNKIPEWNGYHEVFPLPAKAHIYTNEGTLMYGGDRVQLIYGNEKTKLDTGQKGTLTWSITSDYAKHNQKSVTRTLTPSPVQQIHTISTVVIPFSSVEKLLNSHSVNQTEKNKFCSQCACPPY